MLKKEMTIGIILCAVIGIAVCVIFKLTQTKPIPNNFVKVAYLPIYKSWRAEDVQGNLLTDVNIAFATITPDCTILVNPINELDLPKELVALKEKYPHLKINLSIGGWGLDGFSDMALTKKTRSIFIESIVSYLELFNLDGVDIDWEFPTQDASGLTKTRPEDTKNFIHLMKEMRSEFNKLYKTNNKKYRLSFAAPMSDWAIKAFGVKEVSKSVDYIYLMGYDYIGRWSMVTGHQSNLLDCKEAPVHQNTYEGIQRYLKVCKPEKLVVGVPAYGYGWKGVNNSNNGLFQSAATAISAEEMDLSYNNLKAGYISKNGYTRYWDDISKSAYLYNGDIWITYEDIEAIRYKADTVKTLGLGGMMYWEHTQDVTGDIITTISDVLSGR
ncbi:MAG: glycoside hydrolase family 18 protein [Oscillospiraceae bacterium]